MKTKKKKKTKYLKTLKNIKFDFRVLLDGLMFNIQKQKILHAHTYCCMDCVYDWTST